jgi:hypothetical protein
MSTRGPQRRPTLAFQTHFGTYLLHERSSFYQCLSAASYPDTNKQAILCFLFDLRCFTWDTSREVSFRRDIHPHVHLLSRHFPLALQFIILHDKHVTLTKARSRQSHTHRVRVSRQQKRKLLENQIPHPTIPLEPFDFPAFPLEEEEEEEDRSTPALLTQRGKHVLFIGIRRPPFVRPIPVILQSASHLSNEKQVDLRDEARCASALQLGYVTYTLDRKPSESPFHVCAELGGLHRAHNLGLLEANTFDEICVDFVWMPLAYIDSGIFTTVFFSRNLPLFANLLRKNCCIYLPANVHVFKHIIQNWTEGGKLGNQFILRFLGLRQAKEEIKLVRATSALSLAELGMDDLDSQLAHFCIHRSVISSLIQELNPALSYLLDWLTQDEVIFLGLSKIDQSTFVHRFGAFSGSHQGFKRCGREATQLSAETSDLLTRNFRWIQSGLSRRNQPPAAVLPVTYHNLFLNSAYGLDLPAVSVSKRGKRIRNPKSYGDMPKKNMAEPKFNPASAGIPKEAPPGQWVCPACTNSNGLSELYCHYCAKTPPRSAKEGVLYQPPAKDLAAVSELAGAFAFVEDNETSDSTFQKQEHNELLLAKQISEFGRIWRKEDTKSLNSRLHSEWRKLDARPTKEIMWSTHIFVPCDSTWSSTRIDSAFRLDRQLKGVFSQTITIEKQACHAVCCFRLDIRPHAVSGPLAFKKCSLSTEVLRSFQMKKDRNHFFQERNPYYPIVLNLNDVSGLGDSKRNTWDQKRDAIIIKKLSFPQKLIGLDLLTQIRLLLENGLERFADEFVSLAMPDDRTILAFNMGYSPKEANKWTRKNGCSVARPGLYNNSLRASQPFRRWVLHLALLIGDQFLDQFLKGTSQQQQCPPKPAANL